MLKTTLIEAAKAGAAEIVRFFNSDFKISNKEGVNNLVTEADHAAEKAILSVIKSHFPEHQILAEETGEIIQDSDYKWIIDPIDGTKSFIHGVPIYGCLLALAEGDHALVGVAQFPALNETVAAARSAIAAFDRAPLVTPVVSAHVMGGYPLGPDPHRAVVDLDGRHHQLANLHVLDGSLFPTSIGANPQLSIYGIVAKLADALAASLGRPAPAT
mgnify:CR=1 FL=1